MSALEPKPTKQDLRVLKAVPACGGDRWRRREVHETATVWQIAEALDMTDLQDLQLTLNGFFNFGYIDWAKSKSRNRRVWWRTPKGDAAVEQERKGC